ncbi:arginase family protein [Actinomadura sp. ATCC 31491]|uniref:Arginase family protein n=1 Tax=Actinomadura luzonensis TaxID=2805427 RepID=A0ABT0FLP1_9ACTN|nr:arginase family protein [Actinomadura luzonensis]MCK2213242.1 arginase family protein [Actinomadura luzonensis]
MLRKVAIVEVPQWRGSGSRTAERLREGARVVADLAEDAARETGTRAEAGAGAAARGEHARGEHGGVVRVAVTVNDDDLVATAAEVRDALEGVARDALVVAVGGDCGVELEPIAAARRRYGDRLVVVWFDAHGDLNTPQSSPSGAYHGMVLRALTGEGPEGLVAEAPLQPGRIVLAGVRDLDPAEAAFVESAGVRWVKVAETGTEDALLQAITAATSTGTVYPHTGCAQPGHTSGVNTGGTDGTDAGDTDTGGTGTGGMHAGGTDTGGIDTGGVDASGAKDGGMDGPKVGGAGGGNAYAASAGIGTSASAGNGTSAGMGTGAGAGIGTNAGAGIGIGVGAEGGRGGAAADTGPVVYVHVDLDVLDPEIFGSVGCPSPGGIHPERLLSLVRAVAGRFEVAGLGLMEYEAMGGRDGDRDRELLAELVSGLVRAAAGQPGRTVPR